MTFLLSTMETFVPEHLCLVKKYIFLNKSCCCQFPPVYLYPHCVAFKFRIYLLPSSHTSSQKKYVQVGVQTNIFKSILYICVVVIVIAKRLDRIG